MLEGEIGQSLRQAEVPTAQQQRILDKSARPRNRLKVPATVFYVCGEGPLRASAVLPQVSEFAKQRLEAGPEAGSDHDALVTHCALSSATINASAA